MKIEEPEIGGLTRMTKKKISDSCKKNKLYMTPYLNDVLYLHYQGYQEIECLEEYTGLKCLWLECNAISEISGLTKQTELRCLFLQNNLIQQIENLENCVNLDTLNLSHNFIHKIENCDSSILPILTSLNLSHNSLRTAINLQLLSDCKLVSVLDLSHNRINDVLVVHIFGQMPELKVLVLTGNPVINEIPSYRKTLILECKKLTYLDERPVFDRDRACAEAWKRGGFEEEKREHIRWNKADKKKIRDSVNATLARRKNEDGTPMALLHSSDDDNDDYEKHIDNSKLTEFTLTNAEAWDALDTVFANGSMVQELEVPKINQNNNQYKSLLTSTEQNTTHSVNQSVHEIFGNASSKEQENLFNGLDNEDDDEPGEEDKASSNYLFKNLSKIYHQSEMLHQSNFFKDNDNTMEKQPNIVIKSDSNQLVEINETRKVNSIEDIDLSGINVKQINRTKPLIEVVASNNFKNVTTNNTETSKISNVSGFETISTDIDDGSETAQNDVKLESASVENSHIAIINENEFKEIDYDINAKQINTTNSLIEVVVSNNVTNNTETSKINVSGFETVSTDNDVGSETVQADVKLDSASVENSNIAIIYENESNEIDDDVVIPFQIDTVDTENQARNIEVNGKSSEYLYSVSNPEPDNDAVIPCHETLMTEDNDEENDEYWNSPANKQLTDIETELEIGIVETRNIVTTSDEESKDNFVISSKINKFNNENQALTSKVNDTDYEDLNSLPNEQIDDTEIKFDMSGVEISNEQKSADQINLDRLIKFNESMNLVREFDYDFVTPSNVDHESEAEVNNGQDSNDANSEYSINNTTSSTTVNSNDNARNEFNVSTAANLLNEIYNTVHPIQELQLSAYLFNIPNTTRPKINVAEKYQNISTTITREAENFDIKIDRSMRNNELNNVLIVDDDSSLESEVENISSQNYVIQGDIKDIVNVNNFTEIDRICNTNSDQKVFDAMEQFDVETAGVANTDFETVAADAERDGIDVKENENKLSERIPNQAQINENMTIDEPVHDEVYRIKLRRRIETIDSLLSTGNLSWLQDSETVNREYELLKSGQAEQITEIVNRVYAQKDRYFEPLVINPQTNSASTVNQMETSIENSTDSKKTSKITYFCKDIETFIHSEDSTEFVEQDELYESISDDESLEYQDCLESIENT